MIISVQGKLQLLKELVQFQYIVKPECITDTDEQTLIYLALLNNSKAVVQAIDANEHDDPNSLYCLVALGDFEG
ncbi:1902_t:CDS:2, partial [Scutellospora calospora]